jgi:hypothetical protein
VLIDVPFENGKGRHGAVQVGGVPLNEAFASSVGADSDCRDAAVGGDGQATHGQATHGQAPGLGAGGKGLSFRRFKVAAVPSKDGAALL